MTRPTLYIIHGWAYSVDPWETTLSTLKKDGYPIKMLHVPGLTEPSTSVFTIDDYIKWADRELPDGAIALGHSNGGRILLNLLSKNPKKLSHLILLDSAGVYETSKKRDILRKISKLGAPLKNNPFLRKVYHRLTGASDYDRAPENMKKTMQNLLESDKHLDLTRVTTPTTIIWGSIDSVTPPRQADTLHKKLPHSTLEFHENWTHAPYICDPLGLAHALESAIDTITEKKS